YPSPVTRHSPPRPPLLVAVTTRLAHPSCERTSLLLYCSARWTGIGIPLLLFMTSRMYIWSVQYATTMMIHILMRLEAREAGCLAKNCNCASVMVDVGSTERAAYARHEGCTIHRRRPGLMRRRRAVTVSLAVALKTTRTMRNLAQTNLSTDTDKRRQRQSQTARQSLDCVRADNLRHFRAAADLYLFHHLPPSML
ncbi:hypothetical protein BC628DRAFT_1450274, partial [Trametes gibbosa]